MTEKELIKYLLLDLKIFKEFEKKFLNSILTEIRNSIDVQQYCYKDGLKNINILREYFSDKERKHFINRLLIEYYNQKKIEYTRFPLSSLGEEDIENLSYEYIKSKFKYFESHFQNFHSSVIEKSKLNDFDELVSREEIKKIICKIKIKNIQIKYLYDFFYNEEKDWNYIAKNSKKEIESDIENTNILIIFNKKFIEKDYCKVLDKFREIEFKNNCIFEDIESESLITNKSINLKFEQCEFIGEFKHIFCQSVFFKNCKIEKYYHNNIAEKKNVVAYLLFMDCKIDILDLEGLELQSQLFKNTNNMKDEDKHIKLLRLQRCEVKKSFRVDIENREKNEEDKRFKITKLDLTNTVFKPNKDEKAKVKIQFCDIGIGVFLNTSFHDLADFYRTKFRRSINFSRADFMNISVFSECIFNCNVNFQYVKFFGKAIFRDTVISKNKKLNLRDTIFDDEANFLDISGHDRKNNKGEFIGEPSDIKVANRETARIIKNFYDNSNNIIEANRFYKLEMIERENELDFKKRPLEWIVFKSHRLASNHSQGDRLKFRVK